MGISVCCLCFLKLVNLDLDLTYGAVPTQSLLCDSAAQVFCLWPQARVVFAHLVPPLSRDTMHATGVRPCPVSLYTELGFCWPGPGLVVSDPGTAP